MALGAGAAGFSGRTSGEDFSHAVAPRPANTTSKASVVNLRGWWIGIVRFMVLARLGSRPPLFTASRQRAPDQRYGRVADWSRAVLDKSDVEMHRAFMPLDFRSSPPNFAELRSGLGRNGSGAERRT